MASEGNGTTTFNEEQLSFMQTCEQEFKNRYTDEDPDFKQTKESGDPPVVTPWYNKPRRNFDWTNRRDDRNDRYGDRQYGSRSFDHPRNNRYADRQYGWYNDRQYGGRGRDYGRNDRYGGRPYQRRYQDGRRDGGYDRS